MVATLWSSQNSLTKQPLSMTIYATTFLTKVKYILTSCKNEKPIIPCVSSLVICLTPLDLSKDRYLEIFILKQDYIYRLLAEEKQICNNKHLTKG